MSAEVVTLVIGISGILGTLFSGIFTAWYLGTKEERRREDDRKREDALRIEERTRAARAEEILRIEQMLDSVLELQEEILQGLRHREGGLEIVDNETGLRLLGKKSVLISSGTMAYVALNLAEDNPVIELGV